MKQEMSMKTLLMHNNDGNPISIMPSDDIVFHTIKKVARCVPIALLDLRLIMQRMNL